MSRWSKKTESDDDGDLLPEVKPGDMFGAVNALTTAFNGVRRDFRVERRRNRLMRMLLKVLAVSFAFDIGLTTFLGVLYHDVSGKLSQQQTQCIALNVAKAHEAKIIQIILGNAPVPDRTSPGYGGYIAQEMALKAALAQTKCSKAG